MLTAGATFIARAYAGNPKHAAEMIQMAIEHKGFAFIDVLSPCRTWLGIEQKSYLSEHIYYLEEEDGYDPLNKSKAWEVATEEEDIALGLIYKEDIPTYDMRYADLRHRAQEKGVPGVEEILERYIP
jgi:2-oxoglutarate ferredoxin oxidoreductase subunit beta